MRRLLRLAISNRVRQLAPYKEEIQERRLARRIRRLTPDPEPESPQPPPAEPLTFPEAWLEYLDTFDEQMARKAEETTDVAAWLAGGPSGA
jgi:hypothetical protein